MHRFILDYAQIILPVLYWLAWIGLVVIVRRYERRRRGG